MEEVYIAISVSPSFHATPSAHMPEIILSCVLKLPAPYSAFLAGKDASWCSETQRNKSPFLSVTDELLCLGGEGTGMY